MSLERVRVGHGNLEVKQIEISQVLMAFLETHYHFAVPLLGIWQLMDQSGMEEMTKTWMHINPFINDFLCIENRICEMNELYHRPDAANLPSPKVRKTSGPIGWW